MKQSDLIAHALDVTPDLDELDEHLDSAETTLFHGDDHGAPRSAVPFPRAIIGAPVDELADDEREALGRQRRRAVEGARRAVEKIKRDGADADLDPGEVLGLEAIVIPMGRPAILIQDGKFFPPPHPWEDLEQSRDSIERTCRSVGRIEVNGHPALDWLGTGFLVADDVVITNRHVAKEFCRQAGGKSWTFEPQMTARIDYAEEFGGAAQAEFALEEVLGVHDSFDLALFRAAARSKPAGATRPEPLPIAASAPKKPRKRKVYVVGYPAADSRRNDPSVMQKIFANIYNVKRLQPGEIRSVSPKKSQFTHDCSTLGGNSGSAVVDLESEQVVGLHFQGRYLENNWAVALWRLRDDPLVKKAKLNFQ